MLLPIYFLLSFSLAAASEVSITEFAVPSQVKAGEGAELQCRWSARGGAGDAASATVKWWWTPAQPNAARTQIYQRLGHNPPQTLHKHIFGEIIVKANDTIELRNLQPSLSGTYECECAVDEIYEDRRKQDLIVYTPGTGPQLNVTIVKNETSGEQDFELTCDADGVAPEPEMALTIYGKTIPVEETVLNGTVDGKWNVAATAILDEVESGAEIKCELFYKDSDITHPAYISFYSYEGSGGGVTPEHLEVDSEVVTDREDASTPAPGSSVAHSSCALLLVVAMLSNFLQHH